jgi:hypothetical protein
VGRRWGFSRFSVFAFTNTHRHGNRIMMVRRQTVERHFLTVGRPQLAAVETPKSFFPRS